MKKQILILLLIILLSISFNIQAEKVHRVATGESLYQIACNYGITVNEIINKNNLRNPNTIYNKEVIIIPDTEKAEIYRVQQGDTLFKISKSLGVPMGVLSTVNHIENQENLSIRQPLYIPYRYRYPIEYTVKKGDTIYSISQQFYVAVEEILLLNRLNNDIIDTGMVLKIPVVPAWNPPDYNEPDYVKLFPDTFFLKGKTNSYNICLTFDDGPDALYTPQILDILRKYNVPATFFLIGNKIIQYPEVVKRIIAEGHIIANHTWSHPDLTKITKEELIAETKLTEDILKDITALRTALIRPPEGAVSENVINSLQELSYKVIFWSVDSRDWLDRDIDQILINTLPDINKDSIILFHSAGGKGQSLDATLKSLPELIETLKLREYNFVNLDELLNISVYQ
jgi:peptidoglycan-N-acetylglucosamine deacetylase